MIWIVLGAVAAFVLLLLALAALERGGDPAEDGQEPQREEGGEP